MGSKVDAARRAAILARAPLVAKGTCHYCDVRVGTRGALWCAAWCAGEYEKERVDLLEPKALSFGVMKGGESVPVISKVIHGAEDDTPLQTISADLLGYYQRLDKAARVLLSKSQIEQIRTGVYL
jgi:hypothetical protein